MIARISLRISRNRLYDWITTTWSHTRIVQPSIGARIHCGARHFPAKTDFMLIGERRLWWSLPYFSDQTAAWSGCFLRDITGGFIMMLTIDRYLTSGIYLFLFRLRPWSHGMAWYLPKNSSHNDQSCWLHEARMEKWPNQDLYSFILLKNGQTGPSVQMDTTILFYHFLSYNSILQYHLFSFISRLLYTWFVHSSKVFASKSCYWATSSTQQPFLRF